MKVSAKASVTTVLRLSAVNVSLTAFYGDPHVQRSQAVVKGFESRAFQRESCEKPRLMSAEELWRERFRRKTHPAMLIFTFSFQPIWGKADRRVGLISANVISHHWLQLVLTFIPLQMIKCVDFFLNCKPV